MDVINLNDVIKEVIFSHAIKRNQKDIYEIVIPYLSSRMSEGRTSVIMPKKYTQQDKSIRAEYYGNIYLIRYDFYNYDGEKNNRENIDKYLSNYKSIVIHSSRFRYTVYSKKLSQGEDEIMKINDVNQFVVTDIMQNSDEYAECVITDTINNYRFYFKGCAFDNTVIGIGSTFEIKLINKLTDRDDKDQITNSMKDAIYFMLYGDDRR